MTDVCLVYYLRIRALNYTLNYIEVKLESRC